jgi:hypothetical protein
MRFAGEAEEKVLGALYCLLKQGACFYVKCSGAKSMGSLGKDEVKERN